MDAIAQPALTASTTASILLALLGALLFAVSAALQHHVVGVHSRHIDPAAEARVPVQAQAPAQAQARVPAQAQAPAQERTSPPQEGPRSGPVAVRERTGTVPAVRAASRRPRVLTLLRRLVLDPMWLLGWVANVAGFAAQAAALHLGSIVIVQALLVAQLLFALPLSALPAGRRPLRRDWLGTAAVCCGLVTLLTVRGAVPQTTARRGEVWFVLCAAAALVLLLLLASRMAAGQQYRTAAVAAAAGVCFCLTAGRSSSGTARISRPARAMPSGVPSLTAPQPGVTSSSRAAPSAGTTTGVPHASASSVARPKVSAGDADSARSAPAISSARARRSDRCRRKVTATPDLPPPGTRQINKGKSSRTAPGARDQSPPMERT